MELEKFLKLKKIKVQEVVGFDIVDGEMGRKIKKYRVIEKDATPEDVLAFNEERGTFVTKDGKKYSIYK